MSPVAAGLDGLLALLLVLALALGLKLNGRLKALREGQAGFAQAVAELNDAAARAEAGLATLKAASESAHDDLLARIETARGLVVRLERAGAEAARMTPVEPLAAAAPLRTAGAMAAIAALAEGRAPERAKPEAGARPAPSRRPGRINLDDDLFETDRRAPDDLGPLRSSRGAR